MSEPTDREKVDFIAEKLGTLKRKTNLYSYISDVRYRWNEKGQLIQVSRLRSGTTWEDVRWLSNTTMD